MSDLKKYIVMLLVLVGYVGAAETFTDTHHFGCDGLLWDFESPKLKDNKSVLWSHTLDGFVGNCTITEATLTIEGNSIENLCDYEQINHVSVHFMGQDLGLLKGNSTTYDLLPYSSLIGSVNESMANISFQNDLFKMQGFCGSYDVDLDWQDSIYLKTSLLKVVCEPLPPSTVPAPSAVVLGSIGICLVGWLRKRTSASV